MNWAEVKTQAPEAYQALKNLGVRIFQKNQDSFLLNEKEQKAISSLKKENEIAISDGKIRFSEPSKMHNFLATLAIESLELTSESDPSEFTRKIFLVEYRTQKVAQQRLGGHCLVILNNQYDVDVLGIIETSADNHNSFWRMYGIFCDALPNMDIGAQQIVRSIARTLEKANRDTASFKIYQAIQQFAGKSKERAVQIYNESIKQPLSPVISLAFHALIALSKFDFDEAYSYADQLVSDENPVFQRVGISALGAFLYELPGHEKN